MHFDQIKRREFITLLGGAAVAWPLAVRAQQPALPEIGLLSSASPNTFEDRLRAFREGLKESAGYREGDNVIVVYRWAEGQNDRLPAMADELVRRRVAVIAALGEAATYAAKAATSTIPIVFNVDDDPVKLGLVTNMARPEGNLSGSNFFVAELTAKRLELLRQLVPTTSRLAVLVNPTYPVSESTVRDVAATAPKMGFQIRVYEASTSREIDAVFADIVRERHDALFVGGDPFYTSRRAQLVDLTSQHKIPTTFATREFAQAGGLMSYGAKIADAWRQVGAYAGKILKGAKPSDLPVVQPTKFDFVINLKTAKALGITVPPTLLATVDDVIE
jgi:putative tryptophan/tyrosine transport system substrate-binding protein